ncbi:hypothetical protein M7I_2774 [Glarea lozoyensis 74030]|uniref:Uncharacterized protein n=1 Tax=Glarea lozoyensis (strain ATCC 74030 / MF5533) TaxID=1104152 RepID=H0EJP4_GLAL7|nr:hypothetical protein M7I_2774 [Glarea lozoyensis 74030]
MVAILVSQWDDEMPGEKPRETQGRYDLKVIARNRRSGLLSGTEEFQICE